MAERRMIRKDLWDTDGFDELTISMRYLFLSIIPYADDEGCFNAQAKYLKKKFFFSDRVSLNLIQDMLNGIRNRGFVILGEEKYLGLGYIPTWFKMQTYPSHKGKVSEYTDFLTSIGVVPRWGYLTQGNGSEVNKIQGNGMEANTNESILRTKVKKAWNATSESLEAERRALADGMATKDGNS